MKNYKLLIVFSIVALIGSDGISTAHAMDAQSLIDKAQAFNQAETSAVRFPVSELLDTLTLASFVTREGADADQRPIFVNAQADFERAIVALLRSRQIVSCACIIHAPAPATPLCTNGEISLGLVDGAIENDQERLLSVKQRPDIIRDYLREGGDLFTVYPKNGRRLRSPEQLEILEGLIRTHFDHLHAIELDCDAIPHDLIGATYFITFADSSIYALSLRGSQANSPTDDHWAIWFGAVQDAAVAERLHAVMSFLKSHGCSLPALPF